VKNLKARFDARFEIYVLVWSSFELPDGALAERRITRQIVGVEDRAHAAQRVPGDGGDLRFGAAGDRQPGDGGAA
jgi:hypothetical protein